MEYLYGNDKTIIAKNIKGQPKMLSIDEIKYLIDNKNNICDQLKNGYYIEIENIDVCAECENKKK